MADFIPSLLVTPVPTLLVLAGIVLLLLSVIAKIGEKIVVDPRRQKHAAFLGIMLLIVGLGLGFVTPCPEPFEYRDEYCNYLRMDIASASKGLDESGSMTAAEQVPENVPENVRLKREHLTNIERRIEELTDDLGRVIMRRDQICREVKNGKCDKLNNQIVKTEHVLNESKDERKRVISEMEHDETTDLADRKQIAGDLQQRLEILKARRDQVCSSVQ